MEVALISDLCELCENKADEVHEIARTTIVACHPRAVKSLMAFVDEDDVRSLNLRCQTADEVLAALGVQPAQVSKEESEVWMKQMEVMPQSAGRRCLVSRNRQGRLRRMW